MGEKNKTNHLPISWHSKSLALIPNPTASYWNEGEEYKCKPQEFILFSSHWKQWLETAALTKWFLLWPRAINLQFFSFEIEDWGQFTTIDSQMPSSKKSFGASRRWKNQPSKQTAIRQNHSAISSPYRNSNNYLHSESSQNCVYLKQKFFHKLWHSCCMKSTQLQIGIGALEPFI